jgi:hypothetical protein
MEALFWRANPEIAADAARNTAESQIFTSNRVNKCVYSYSSLS